MSRPRTPCAYCGLTLGAPRKDGDATVLEIQWKDRTHPRVGWHLSCQQADPLARTYFDRSLPVAERTARALLDGLAEREGEVGIPCMRRPKRGPWAAKPAKKKVRS